jgi:protein phosphatase
MSDLLVHGEPIILFAEECERGTVSEENQDSILNIRIGLGDLLLVAGGISGKAGGAIASQMAVEHFNAHLASLPRGYPVEDALREAAARANTNILGAARVSGSAYSGMGSTVVAAVLQQEGDATYAWIGHVGDSRAYLLRAGRLQRLTFDHSAVQEMLNRQEITPLEAVGHPEAAVLTRYLGQRSEVEIEIDHLPFAVGDTLLLCSGGLWKSVPEVEIETAAGSVMVEDAAHKMLEMALTSGSEHNIGIEMARLTQLPDPPPSEAPKNPIMAVLAVFILALASVCILAWYIQ